VSTRNNPTRSLERNSTKKTDEKGIFTKDKITISTNVFLGSVLQQQIVCVFFLVQHNATHGANIDGEVLTEKCFCFMDKGKKGFNSRKGIH
jgi:hypothetical protein